MEFQPKRDRTAPYGSNPIGTPSVASIEHRRLQKRWAGRWRAGPELVRELVRMNDERVSLTELARIRMSPSAYDG